MKRSFILAVAILAVAILAGCAQQLSQEKIEKYGAKPSDAQFLGLARQHMRTRAPRNATNAEAKLGRLIQVYGARNERFRPCREECVGWIICVRYKAPDPKYTVIPWHYRLLVTRHGKIYKTLTMHVRSVLPKANRCGESGYTKI